MSSLARDLVKKAHGEIKVYSSGALSSTTYADIITPTAGTKICILSVINRPTASNSVLYLGLAPSGTDPSDKLFIDGMVWAYSSFYMNYERCPPIGGKNWTLQYKIATNSVRLMVHYLELPV